MDRNEAVQRLSKGGHLSIAHAEDLYDSFFEKPVVQQYVADWYEEHKDEFEINLFQEVCRSKEIYECGGLTDFQKWLIGGETRPFSVLVNMHHFGYEVEEEKRYTVRVKGIDGYSKYLNRDTNTQRWLFASKTELERFRAHHTRKELEDANFGWVFSCPGVEVKEVDDGND